MSSLTKRIIAGFIVIGLLIPTAYYAERHDREKGIQSGKVISVKDGNGELVSLMGTDVIRALSKQQFPGDGQAKGPTLLYVIGASGLTGYSTIEVTGLEGEQHFQAGRQELDDSYVLVSNDRGTVSLVQRSSPERVLVDEISVISKIN
ncbi:hypothetical protein J2Z22_004659 [Paenibacillus forsythiae]|uniref:Uncharacterized protein n=1 Tax=Paenibacillus forsythiae TaxID=365616 RepID=A0ABU3HHB8_9BACL|nr:hypothetical protein [Paenibacillus forsythiae]MDT3429060.1 hypothetical protein [Paenibacillus forsythiae]